MKFLDNSDFGGLDQAKHSAGLSVFPHHEARSEHHAGETQIRVHDASLLFSGTYRQSGHDLIISKPFESVTIHDYFRYDVRPGLVAPDGSALSADTVAALTQDRRGDQYADNEAPAHKTAIGRVESLTGTATVIRNGETITLHPGDLVYKGDAVATDEHGSLAITFIDGTAFTLAQNARMVLNDMVYQQNGAGNSALLSLVQGSITFVAGEVAHSGDMKVDTPVATMGIRGTAVHVNITSDDGPTRFSVMREPDGRVGSYILYDHKDGHPLATVSEVGTVVELHLADGQIVINTMPKTPLDLQQEQEFTNQVFQAFQAGQQDQLLKALTLPQSPNQTGGGSHGSSGPPQTGPAAGTPDETGPDSSHPSSPPPSSQASPPGSPSPPPSGNGNQPQLLTPDPIVAPATPQAPTAPAETIIIAKNAAFDAALPIIAETVTAIQGGHTGLTPVGSGGTTIVGLYGDLTINPDGAFHYVADHAAALLAGVFGVDRFTYTVTNASGQTASTALTFDVAGASNNPIVAAPVSGGEVPRTAGVQTINLLAGTTDPNPNETVTIQNNGSGHSGVQVSVLSGPVDPNAIVYSIDGSGHLSIDPSQFLSFGSSHSIELQFSYTLTNASGGETAQTATLTVDAPSLSPVITVPGGQTLEVSYGSVISGISLSETGNIAGETFTVTLHDTYGNLSVSGSGGTVAGSGTTSLTITGTLGQVNSYLATLTDTDLTHGRDTITLNAIDSFGNSAAQQTIGATAYYYYSDDGAGLSASAGTLTVLGDSSVSFASLTIAAPSTQTVGLNNATAISGLSISEVASLTFEGGTPTQVTGVGETYTVTLHDTYGNLAVTGTGGTVAGSGTANLSISGTLTQVNAYLATLTDTDGTAGADTITVNATGSFGEVASPQTIAVTAASGANWTGDTLQEVYYYPTSSSIYYTAPEVTVPTSSFVGLNQGGSELVFYLEVDGDSVTASNFQFSSYWTSSSFNGFKITDINGNPEISGVTIDPSSNMAGLNASDISFGSDYIWINWQGLSFNSSTVVKLDLTFDPPLDPSHVAVTQTLNGSSSPAYNTASLSVADGTALMLMGVIANLGTISVNGASAATAIGIEGNVTLEGGGHVAFTDSNENYIYGSGTLTNVDNLITGGGDIGNGTLVLHNAGTIEAEGPYALILDTGPNTIINTGTLEAHDGTLIVDSAVLGGGHAVIDGGTIEFTGASDNAVSFVAGSSNTLALDQAQSFTGTVSGFGAQDQIDLGNIGFSTREQIGFAASGNGHGGILTLSDGTHTANISFLDGNSLASGFSLSSDGHGGTLITDAVTSDGTSPAAGVALDDLTVSTIGSGQGDGVTLTGQLAASDETGAISWDAGSAPVAMNITNGTFSATQNLTPGEHSATLTLTDTATNTQTVHSLDIDISALDAPFVFARLSGPAVLIGSSSAGVAQTITGSPSYADTLVAGAGNDMLTGNSAGGDTFVFKTAMGNDQITDLHTSNANGTPDAIDLSAFHFVNYQALLDATTQDANGDAMIALGIHSLTLDHVQKADLQSNLFHL